MSINLPISSLTLPSVGGVGSAGGAPGVAGAAPSGGVDFASFLKEMASNTVNSLQAGEAMSIAGIQGKATTQQVVEAVMQAEQSLHAAVAIRDKVVGAYLEISRMSI
ncbi:MAG: flagellar hook-basal body complex protein FliE [Hyphomicrobium sp.]|nr:flagellar hook-basal body complex protein FliE [Hyphomicrobium sp.]